jgi:hypothetical protein
MDLDHGSEMIILTTFGTGFIFEADGAIAKIGSSLK